MLNSSVLARFRRMLYLKSKELPTSFSEIFRIFPYPVTITLGSHIPDLRIPSLLQFAIHLCVVAWFTHCVRIVLSVNDSSDLATFAKHAGRKGIEESDVQMLLQRQRQIKPQGAKNSVFSVAQKFLPGELLGRVRMVKGGIQKRKGRAPRGRNVDDDDDD